MDEDLTEIVLGWDLFEAQLIAESVRMEGLQVALREMTPEGISNAGPANRHRLMVRVGDLERVRVIVNQSFPLD